MGRCHDERTDVMSGTFTPAQAGDEAVDLRGEGAEPTGVVTATGQGAAGQDRSFAVTIKTPAGHEHRFRVKLAVLHEVRHRPRGHGLHPLLAALVLQARQRGHVLRRAVPHHRKDILPLGHGAAVLRDAEEFLTDRGADGLEGTTRRRSTGPGRSKLNAP